MIMALSESWNLRGMTNLASPQPSPLPFKVQQRDILSELLADKRSPETRRAYAKDLQTFFLASANQEPTPQLVSQFLSLERFTAIALVLQYKAHMIERGLAEATINRRLAAIKSLCRYAQKVGQCQWSLEEVSGEKAQSYRDTSGIEAGDYQKILAACDRATPAGQRNYAILRLLWDNALRRGEVCKLNVQDFQPPRLSILGKGRGTQAEWVDLSAKTVDAIALWLKARGQADALDPLFIALDNAHRGHRITGNAIYQLVRESAQTVGISKVMSPHRCRHSSITAALDATGGDVRKVQKLSRHRKLETVMIYSDAREKHQGQVTNLLSGMV